MQEMVQVGSYSTFTLEIWNLLVCIVAACAKLYTGRKILASMYSMSVPTLAQATANHFQQKHLSLLAQQAKQSQKCLIEGNGVQYGCWCIVLAYGYSEI